MATIRKRCGKYHTQIRKNGHTVTRTFINKADALKWSREEEVKIEKGIYFPEDKNITLSFLLSRWEKEILINLKSYHVEKYKVAMIQRALGHLIVDKITSSILVTYRDERLKKAANQTVKHELGLILRVMRKGVEWGLVKSVPTLTLPSLKGQARTRRLNKDELNNLIDTLEPYLRNITILLIETAMRRGELSSLNINNIDIEHKLLHLIDTKNGENRTIPLSNKAISAIKFLNNIINTFISYIA
jgi:integrase